MLINNIYAYMRKLKKYKVGVDSETYAISLVEEPAMESSWVALEEEKPLQVLMSDNQRHILYGAAIIPDKPIYRRNGGDEFYIEFTAESIEKMAHEFIKNGYQKSMTLDHQTEALEVYVVESWIKESFTEDKSVALGLDLPIGTWCIGVKVNNIDVWNRIEVGELTGFSIEAFIGLEEFNKINNKEEDMNLETNETFWSKLKNIISEALSKKDENTIESDFEETPETPTETVVETPVEATETTDEVTLPTEETKEPEQPKNEETIEETKVEEEEVITPSNEDNVQLNELVKNLMSEIEALKNYNMTLKEKLDDMGKQPSTKPVNVSAGGPSNGDTYSAWREQMKKYM